MYLTKNKGTVKGHEAFDSAVELLQITTLLHEGGTEKGIFL